MKEGGKINITKSIKFPFENLPKTLRKLFKLNEDGSFYFGNTKYHNLKEFYDFEKRNDFHKPYFYEKYNISYKKFMDDIKKVLLSMFGGGVNETW